MPGFFDHVLMMLIGAALMVVLHVAGAVAIGGPVMGLALVIGWWRGRRAKAGIDNPGKRVYVDPT